MPHVFDDLSSEYLTTQRSTGAQTFAKASQKTDAKRQSISEGKSAPVVTPNRKPFAEVTPVSKGGNAKKDGSKIPRLSGGKKIGPGKMLPNVTPKRNSNVEEATIDKEEAETRHYQSGLTEDFDLFDGGLLRATEDDEVLKNLCRESCLEPL